MIYYYFKNKEGLYEAVLNRFLSQFSARLKAVVDQPREPRDYLVEVVWAHLDYFREHRDFAKFFYAVFFGPDESVLGGTLMNATQQVQDLLIEACRKAVASGLVRPERLEALVTALNGMINLWVIVTVKQEAALSRDVAVQIVDLVLDGVASGPRRSMSGPSYESGRVKLASRTRRPF